ncbi:MAG: PepSY-like domain-containing protein [Sedimentisphaerales bacterium]
MTKKNMIVIVMVIAIVCAAVYAKKHDGKIELPKAVRAAIKALYPAGKVEKSEMKKKCLELYEVKLDDNGVEKEIMLDEEGTVVTVETKEKPDALPAAVEKAAASKGKIVQAEKKIVHAKYKLVKLDAPVTKYEVKVEKKGKTIELKIADDGKILKEEEEKKEKKEKHNDDKDEK